MIELIGNPQVQLVEPCEDGGLALPPDALALCFGAAAVFGSGGGAAGVSARAAAMEPPRGVRASPEPAPASAAAALPDLPRRRASQSFTHSGTALAANAEAHRSIAT